MKSQKQLSKLLEPKRNELAELQSLLKSTQNQIDKAVEQGNDALLSLSDEFEELAEKKRQLLREMEELKARLDNMKKKLNYAEDTYGKYLEAIKGGKHNEETNAGRALLEGKLP